MVPAGVDDADAADGLPPLAPFSMPASAAGMCTSEEEEPRDEIPAPPPVAGDGCCARVFSMCASLCWWVWGCVRRGLAVDVTIRPVAHLHSTAIN